MTIDATTAGAIATSALGRILDGTVVATVRTDTPLDRIPIRPPDLVCLADAVAWAAECSGFDCRLGDDDLELVRTVGDLVEVVVQRTVDAEGAEDA